MAAQTFAQKMVAALEAALLKNVGVNSISVDGQTVSFASREAMIKELGMWKKQVAQLAGTRPLFRQINLSGGC